MGEKFIKPLMLGFCMSMYVRSHIKGYNGMPEPTPVVTEIFQERLDKLWYKAVNKKKSNLELAAEAIKLQEDAAKQNCLKPVYEEFTKLFLFTAKCPKALVIGLGIENILHTVLRYK